MHRLFLATVLLALSVSASFGQDQEQANVLFRHAQFAEDWTVELGKPVSPPYEAIEAEAILEESPGKYTLGIYHQYDYGEVPIWITIIADDQDLANEIRFDYGPGFDFEEAIVSYREMLGPPESKVESTPRTLIIWQDDHTRFELVRRLVDGNEYFYSLLSNRPAR